MNLLQITLSQADSVAVENTAQEPVKLLDLLLSGGIMMIPILLLSLIALGIFIERIVVINKAKKSPPNLLENVKKLVASGDVKGARALCSQNDSTIGRMLDKGLSRIGHNMKTIEASIENVGKIEIAKLEKNLSFLATIAGAAPMMGFLGTVTGMIIAFQAIKHEEGNVSPQLLSSGISEAMVTTAAGLIVGIIAYLGYNYLVTQLQKVVHHIQFTSIDFIDLLQEPTN